MAGEAVPGAMVFEFFSPGIGEIMRRAGAEFVLYDMEHAGLGFETFKTQVACCRGTGIAPMVRVPRSDYHFLARALDVGAEGVMIPMVESADQARAIAEATRYPPLGRRGAAFGFAHDHYAPGSPADKIAPRQRAQCSSSRRSRRSAGSSTWRTSPPSQGIDVLWVGHFDLTNFLGIPGQFEHPNYLDALQRDRRGRPPPR